MSDGTTAREFEFTQADFEFLRALVTDHTGIVVSDNKRDMLYSRLARRLRALGLNTFAEYRAYLRTHEAEELTNLINAVTTNLTSFFREPHHFEYLARTVIPELLHKKERERRIRIWSAGCSTGEEPYSIAMVLEEEVPPWLEWDIRILATDVDTNVIQAAQHGVYWRDNLRGISDARLQRFFLRGRGANAGQVRVDAELRRMVAFKPLNLLKDWPMKGPFDVIFCRNVMIYFDQATQKRLVERFASLLAPRGYLFIGHSETLDGLTHRFDLVGNTIYRLRA
ncbi:protein-glutamate O-methyltransferase CheR [Thiofaba sp. EF100]|uniref:CheR family methyltransferase n=1 Tax=Thiofaba sp. EF100 TaxID=3121274 RepID=UPI0032220699